MGKKKDEKKKNGKHNGAGLAADIAEAMGHGPKVPKELKKLKPKKPIVPTYPNEPDKELKHLVRQHKALTKTVVSFLNQSRDRKNRKTGELMPCLLPLDAQLVVQEVAQGPLAQQADRLEREMAATLKNVPFYNVFLKNVFGLGPVISAYICTEVDIHKAEKPSNLRRFCGLAVINGRLERPVKGQKNAFSSQMRTRLFQALTAMARNCAKSQKTTKYLAVWLGTKHRILSSARVVDDKLTVVREGKTSTVSAKGFAHSTGWHKAADVLLEDVYIVWRTLEGLPVWPSYYAAKLGYEHGGTIAVNAPKMLTLEEALETVGDVGAWPIGAAALDVLEDTFSPAGEQQASA